MAQIAQCPIVPEDLIEGTSDPHFVIDEHRSADARRYTAEDGRPDRIGRFKAVGGMKIDASRAGGRDRFRHLG